MTPNEAYRELLSIRKHIEDGYVTHLSYGGKADEQTEKDIETYSVAISALEKHIPKKPIVDPANLCNFQNFHCPKCNKKIVARMDGEWIAGKPQNYCDECGQALDWSDTE